MTESAKVQDTRKGVSYVGSKASKQIWRDLNKSSLERGSLDAALSYSSEVHTPKKGVKNAEPKALAVVQDTGKELR